MVFCLGDSDPVSPPPFWNKKKVSPGYCVSIHENIGDYTLNMGAGKLVMLTTNPTAGRAGSFHQFLPPSVGLCFISKATNCT